MRGLQLNGLLYGIIAAGMKGVAAKQPGAAFDCSDERAVHPDRRNHVFGTGRVKTAARRKKWRNKNLVSPDQDDNRLSKGQIN